VLGEHVPGFKQRGRGLSAGQTLTAIASCQLAGGDHLVSLDRRRADTAGQELQPVPTPASTTTASDQDLRVGPGEIGCFDVKVPSDLG
jgi:hypothetical protein